ncbi:MAG: 50S ribosomal protein L29 [Candidatus Nomurabacteria bacterium]|jgi:ribosomal protein L29|nr:50S ribosomal protein L29 [Candidatus Nomurabacteria bacterium]
MADKKTTKVTAKKAELSLPEQLAEKRKELIEAKRGHAAGELQNPRAIGQIRKDIARIMTEINAKKGVKND